MLEWKQQWKGRYALLIKGARRVGKSTLVEEFAKREYKSYILIDFSKPSKQINELFEDMMDLDYFFVRLQTLMKVNLYDRESVIVFDRCKTSHWLDKPSSIWSRMGDMTIWRLVLSFRFGKISKTS